MHYKNGREAKIGDKVVTKDYAGNPISGIVGHANTQSNSWNLYIYPMRPIDQQRVTASECLHIDDVLPVTKPA